MLKRYESVQGAGRKRAEIYGKSEHGINRADIELEALKIIRRLHSFGHKAYVVGGGVRDLLLGRKPKDFDVVTDAHPKQIKRIFRNSRIIGKRFKLVHIFFQDKIIEVSTFRAPDSDGDNNIFGSMPQDVRRRDFTVNALYYNPEDETIVDYVGGFKDVRARRLVPVIPLKTIFTEDPVRMLRAVKYASGCGLKMSLFLRLKIRKLADRLGEESASRLTEEFFKILQSGMAAPMMLSLLDFGLLARMTPVLAGRLKSDPEGFGRRWLARLAELDAGAGRPHGRDQLLVAVCRDFVDELNQAAPNGRALFHEAYGCMKEFLRPLSPANKDLDAALVEVMHRKKKRPRPPAPKRREGAAHHTRASGSDKPQRDVQERPA